MSEEIKDTKFAEVISAEEKFFSEKKIEVPAEEKVFTEAELSADEEFSSGEEFSEEEKTPTEEQSAKAEDPEFISKARGVIEAVLFAAGHPIKYEKLAQVLELTTAQARKLVAEFADGYNDPAGEKGIILLMFEDSCQLCTKEQYGPYIREALGIRRGGNLSPSSIEVLAIIAYNEPVTRAYVETVRGVDSSYAITSLTDKHLIEVCGRLDVPGRPLLYRTTEDFLRVFGMESLGDLPEVSITPDSERQQSLEDIEDMEEAPEAE